MSDIILHNLRVLQNKRLERYKRFCISQKRNPTLIDYIKYLVALNKKPITVHKLSILSGYPPETIKAICEYQAKKGLGMMYHDDPPAYSLEVGK
jgi:hypothetical protein